MSVIKKEAYFLSSTGKNKIHCLIWQNDEKEPIAVIQIVHSIDEHIGRYEKFARYMAEKGYIVCGNDHLGHGLSASSIDEIGFIAEENGDNRIIDDIHILYSIMHRKNPTLPYFLLGHSIGSAIARVYASAFWNELSGLILCGSSTLPSACVVLEAPLELLSKKLGKKASVPTTILDKIGSYFVDEPATEKDWLSADEESVKDYIDDPLCGKGLKLGGLIDIIKLCNTAADKELYSLISPELPLLILAGAKDSMSFNGKASTDLAEKFEKAGHCPESFLYPCLRHEILNEQDNEKVFSDIDSWINNNL